MVEGFNKGFMTTSSQAKKEGRKQETNSRESSQLQLQLFSQHPGTQGNQEQYREIKKIQHSETPTPTSSEKPRKPRKQTKSALHQEVSQFNPSGQMSMEKLIKVVLNPQEEVQKFKHLNEKLMIKLEEKNQMDESRIDNYERQMDTFYNIQNHQENL